MPIIAKIVISFLFVILSSGFSFTQVYEFPAGIANTHSYTEELLIRTDKDIYIVGENVLLKIYKLNGITHTTGNISQVVYVELVDDHCNMVSQLKVGVKGTSGSAYVRLPDTLRTGSYFIRSCTHWMQNLPDDLFSFKRISVINPFMDINALNMTHHIPQPDSIVFYPESGSLVSGIKSLIGVRSFQANGKPIQFKGFIIDSNNDTLCKVKTEESGHALFSVTPSGNTDLFLITGEDEKNSKRFSLPHIIDSGLIMRVKINPEMDYISCEINARGKKYNDKSKISFLYCSASLDPIEMEIAIEAGSAVVNLKKDKLPEGLAHIRLIDEGGNPVAGRWIYNKRRSQINYDVRLAERTYSNRDKVELVITATDNEGNPALSDMLISVIKSFSLDHSNWGNRPEYRQLPILTSIASGHNNFDINDLLIFCTNDYNINVIAADSSVSNPEYLPELRGHLVSGTIRDGSTGRPLNNEFVVLSFVGQEAKCRFSRTDEDGNFNFEICEQGTSEVVIQPLSAKYDNYYVELNNPFPVVRSNIAPIPFYPDSSRIVEINNAIIGAQVKNIYDNYLNRSRSKSYLAEESDFYGTPVDTILVTRFIELSSIRELIKEIVPGVSLVERNGKSKIRIVSEDAAHPFDNEPLMLVDGVPVANIDLILTMNPGDLERIEIMRSRYIISDIVLDGIIHFVTKDGNMGALEFENPIFRREFESMQPLYNYKYPDYSDDTLRAGRYPDFRNTLYWNPDLKSDASGKASVEFYTSDESGEYIIVIEGMTADGRTGRAEIPFYVEGGAEQ